MSRVSAIVAMSAGNRVIGKDNKLPWHIPNDLKRFKQLTTGKTVIMGIKTYYSIGKPLPNRSNIVLTRLSNVIIPGVQICQGITDALRRHADLDETFIIGGEYTYLNSMLFWDRIYLTEIHKEFEGDTFFPKLNPVEWKEIERVENITDDGIVYHYVVLDRIRAKENTSPSCFNL